MGLPKGSGGDRSFPSRQTAPPLVPCHFASAQVSQSEVWLASVEYDGVRVEVRALGDSRDENGLAVGDSILIPASGLVKAPPLLVREGSQFWAICLEVAGGSSAYRAYRGSFARAAKKGQSAAPRARDAQDTFSSSQTEYSYSGSSDYSESSRSHSSSSNEPEAAPLAILSLSGQKELRAFSPVSLGSGIAAFVVEGASEPYLLRLDNPQGKTSARAVLASATTPAELEGFAPVALVRDDAFLYSVELRSGGARVARYAISAEPRGPSAGSVRSVVRFRDVLRFPCPGLVRLSRPSIVMAGPRKIALYGGYSLAEPQRKMVFLHWGEQGGPGRAVVMGGQSDGALGGLHREGERPVSDGEKPSALPISPVIMAAGAHVRVFGTTGAFFEQFEVPELDLGPRGGASFGEVDEGEGAGYETRSGRGAGYGAQEGGGGSGRSGGGVRWLRPLQPGSGPRALQPLRPQHVQYVGRELQAQAPGRPVAQLDPPVRELPAELQDDAIMKYALIYALKWSEVVRVSATHAQ